MTQHILNFENVSHPAEPPFDSGLFNCSLKLQEGGLVAVRTEKHVMMMPMGALAVGVLAPTDGVVRFMGKDWQHMSPDEVSAMRAMIGRVFTEDGWISNLDVDENILLAPLHHTHRSREALVAEATDWARRFGLTEIPHVRVHLVKRAELRILEWVRAFVGEKKMILLEYPMNNVAPSMLEILLKETQQLRRRGTAFLWITRSDNEWQALSNIADALYEWKDQQCAPIGGR